MNKIKKRLARYAHSFSLTGLFLGLMFVAASMTPSLLPRPLILQGLLSGVVFAIGYGVGVFLVTLWKYFELHELKGKWRKRAKYILMGVGLACVICTMFFWRSWQNSILTVMDEPIMEERHFVLVVIGFSIIIAVILIALGRLIGRMFRFFINKIHGLVPRRISRFAGFLIALVLLIGILNGVLIRGVYNFVDSAYGKRNDTTDEGVQKPTDSMKVGSTESLIDWESIGRTGRNFISHSPNADEIKEFTGQDAKEPLRVYVGLQTRDSYEERANLALEELKRINAFERKVMILTTPTGTGWMDPYAVYTLEYMHGGDTANVTMQYSYLSSQANVLFSPERASDSAEALFNAVYGHWKTLPEDTRPELYLFGISLGSFGSEQSSSLHKIMNDLPAGALWAGPPFLNQMHGNITKNRNPDSPAWLPTYEDGSLVRFSALENSLDDFGEDWGPMKIIYMQSASDPMVFFSKNLFYKKPEWLVGERGPDISPELRWYPIVTFFQVAADMMMSTSAPLGHGHNYSPISYTDCWLELTEPENWDEEMTTRLKELFLQQDE